MSESIEDFNSGRLLSAEELAQLQREPYCMFKPVHLVDTDDYIEVPAEDIKFEGEFTL